MIFFSLYFYFDQNEGICVQGQESRDSLIDPFSCDAQSNLNSSKTDGSFIVADSNSFLSP